MNYRKTVRSVAKKIPGMRRFAQMVGLLPSGGKIILDPKRPRQAGASSVSLVNLLRDNKAGAAHMETIERQITNSQIAISTLAYRAGNYDAAVKYAGSIIPGQQADDDVLKLCWDSLRDLGRYDIALQGLYTKASGLGLTARVQSRIDHTLYAQDCYEVYSRLVSEHESENPKGYVVMFDLGQRVTTGLMVPITYRLLKNGYSVCSAIAGTMPKSSRPELRDLSCAIRGDGSALTSEPAGAREPHNNWTIDWDGGVVACDGVNYFPFFLERISKLGKKYRAGLDTPEAVALFNNILRRSDLALTICKQLLELASLGKPVRVVSMETHFAPWGIVRRWCEQVGRHHGIHLVSMSNAYGNYFSNLSSIESGTLSVEDMTARPMLRHPFLGGKERFEAYIRENPERLSDLETPKKWIKLDRSKAVENDPARLKVLDEIKRAKTEGRKVFAAFGKVLVDFAAPDDRGHVFEDFPSWAQFLVRETAACGSLLIVKPHPHEIRSEIAMEGVETLRDLLPKNLPQNVIFLDHASFNSYELASLVDASFVWNGTVFAEFPVLGCPVVAESVWAERDYPIDAHTVGNEAEYRKILRGEQDVPLSPSTQGHAAAFLAFLGSPEVMIPFRYIRRAGTNQAIGANKLYHEDLADLELEGDPSIDLIADRFFEFS